MADIKNTSLFFLGTLLMFLTTIKAQKIEIPKGWVEITTDKHQILLHIKYATKDNFTSTRLYPCGRCFLREEVAKALLEVQHALQQKGYGLLLYDCYRPLTIQYKMWNIRPDPHYVANPAKGSMHNRGQAVDLTIVDSEGCPLDMGTPYDFFGKKAHWAYSALPAPIQNHRQMLLRIMKKYGFHPIRTEWWHFSIKHLDNSHLYSWEWDCK